MMLGEPMGNILMRVYYRLTAQLVPVNPMHWVGELPELAISPCRHEKAVFVNRARDVDMLVHYDVAKELNAKVGGFLGINKSKSDSHITLEKDVFTVGDTIRVSIKIDNSKCRKPIEGISVRLLRCLQCVTHDDNDKS